MPLFSKKPTEPAPTPPRQASGATAFDPAQPAGKGRPTPKRREAQAANRRPLVGDSAARTSDQKVRQREERLRAREAMMKGDQKYLPPRDKGPERRFLRDAVDRRWNAGEVLLPAMLVILALSLVPLQRVQVWSMFAAYALILYVIVDCVLLWRRTKAAYRTTFGADPAGGSAMYVVLRAMQMRMSRVPRPAVQRGAELRRH